MVMEVPVADEKMIFCLLNFFSSCLSHWQWIYYAVWCFTWPVIERTSCSASVLACTLFESYVGMLGLVLLKRSGCEKQSRLSSHLFDSAFHYCLANPRASACVCIDTVNSNLVAKSHVVFWQCRCRNWLRIPGFAVRVWIRSRLWGGSGIWIRLGQRQSLWRKRHAQ